MPIGPFVTLLLVCQVSCYQFHLWKAPLMLTILVHMMDESNLSLLWSKDNNFALLRLTRPSSLCFVQVFPFLQKWWGEDGASF